MVSNLANLLSRTTRIITLLLVSGIRCYQGWLRPMLIGSCKFHPTCSEYAAEAIIIHGATRGLWLSVRRISKCHPLSRCGGVDPVPNKLVPMQASIVRIAESES
ncbi:MAG: membrane protein insertion efficiency factor YidD [Planctomycetota bacterium]